MFDDCDCNILKCQHRTWYKPESMPINTSHMLDSWMLADIFKDNEEGVDILMRLQHTPELSDYPWEWMDNMIVALFRWATDKTHDNMILFLDIFINYKTIIEREAIRQKSLIYWTIKLDMMRDEIAKNIQEYNMPNIREKVNDFLEEFSNTFNYYIPLYSITHEFDMILLE